MQVPEETQKGRGGGLFLLMIVLFALSVWGWSKVMIGTSQEVLTYSDFKAELKKGNIPRVLVTEDEVSGDLKLSPPQAAPPGRSSQPPDVNSVRTVPFRAVRVDDPKLIDDLEQAKVEISGSRPSYLSQVLFTWVLPLVILWYVWGFMLRGSNPAAETLSKIGRSPARLVAETDTKTSFDDVAGCDEAKFELQEVVEFLRHQDKFRALGAKIPKGVLLLGPPGTGKTLLARAVAGEARVPFFSLSGSDFVELFVGVGAARVRDLFARAKKESPCIVFIDELDAIGRQRGVHAGIANDEREQTLNQLLVEMDGFEPNIGVILLAATNRPEILDRALLRPGRFDRQVVIDAPDLPDREAILRVHSKGKPLADDVDLHVLAKSTPGFSGADLANVINEAALLAARKDAHEISQVVLQEAVEKVVTGPERRSRRLNDEERRRIAYHEAGHAVVAAYSPHADPVHKISIIPRGRAALGYTLQLPANERFLLTQPTLVDKLKGLLGGRASEEIVFGNVSTGAENDLDQATVLAQQMVCLYGMSDRLGLLHLGHSPIAGYLTPDGRQLDRNCSDETSREVDQEMRTLLETSYESALAIVQEHRAELDAIVAELLVQETLDAAAFRRFLKGAKNDPNEPPLLDYPGAIQ